MKEQALILREQAKNQLLEIKTVDEAVNYINKVKAIETYCKAVKEDNDIVKIVAEQKIRSMRLAGQMLQQTEISSNYGGINVGKEEVPTLKPTLTDLGLTKNESSTYQKIASVPDDVFEKEMELAKEGDSTKDITVSRFRNIEKNNAVSVKIDSEKNLKKYASKLGLKLAYINPDLIVCYRHNSDLENIKLMYN